MRWQYFKMKTVHGLPFLVWRVFADGQFIYKWEFSVNRVRASSRPTALLSVLDSSMTDYANKIRVMVIHQYDSE